MTGGKPLPNMANVTYDIVVDGAFLDDAFVGGRVLRGRGWRGKVGSHVFLGGAQWLSGRVLDPRPKGRGFEPHRHHCVVVLRQDTFILA